MEMGQIQTLSDDSGGKPCILDDSGFLTALLLAMDLNLIHLLININGL